MERLPRASVQADNLDGSNKTTFASSLRNQIGLAFHLITKALYVAYQERDDLVPDSFTCIQKNDFYGWPYSYSSPTRRFNNGISERFDLVAITRTDDVLYQAHSAVIFTVFYRDTRYPILYRNNAFASVTECGDGLFEYLELLLVLKDSTLLLTKDGNNRIYQI